MSKKGRQFFQEKNMGDTRQLPPRVTPTLVTPLICTEFSDLIGFR